MALRSIFACFAAALIASFTSIASGQAASSLPEGWESPTNADLAGPNLELRANKPGRYLVAEGDFDGDGVSDRAEILVNRFSRTYAVYAFVSTAPAPVELIDGRIHNVGRIGISVSESGRIRTACGKGYDADDPECKRGIPFVDIPFQSIEYFGFESGASQFYWTGEAFARVTTSD